MADWNFRYSHHLGKFVKKDDKEIINYDNFVTPTWIWLIAFFRYYPDILMDICESDNPEFHLSLINRVMLRAAARYERTFVYASRGTGKTTCIVSDRCVKGLVFPGEIVGYYAPAENQAAPIASKAFATFQRNYQILANMWSKDRDSAAAFKLTTRDGSQFMMKIPRGLDTSSLIAEECGQEDGKNPFDWENFNQIVLPTNRKEYKVNGISPKGAVNLQVHYITSASRKENPAYQTCMNIRDDMRNGGSAFACWIPWQTVVLSRMKSMAYYRNLKRQLTAEQFMRECESKCTGSITNPIVKDSDLQASRKLMLMEDRHCGDKECFYILGYDVSSRDISGNAMTATAVLKCEKQRDTSKWDRYRKSLVYVTDSTPPKSAEEHAMLIKKRWRDYMLEGCKGTFIVLDARAYGQSVVEQLHRDLGDGLPPLATITHEPPYNELEQEGAISCIYPLQATGMTGRDPNSEMLDYIEREIENGNIRLLTPNIVDATKAYKLKHNITDDNEDAAIQHPYLKTNKLCQQIGNLQKRYSAIGWTEKEISDRIPKDEWSALLYASRLAQRFEKEELYYENRAQNEWEKYAARYDGKGLSDIPIKTRSVKRLGRGAIRR